MRRHHPPTPRPISQGFDLHAFSCGSPDLDTWLRDRALTNEANGASRTFVSTRGRAVIGFYSISAASVEQDILPGSIRRNMPSQVPSVLLGRLAVHCGEQFRGIGRFLIRDALLRTLHAADQIGIRLMVCRPLDDDARAFYLRNAFLQLPSDPTMVAVDLLQSRRQLIDRWPTRVSEPPAVHYR